ncbi:sugar transferase [Candidatus Pelagibacter sp.]|nr:sugar transferase [Candidatus Pelagibacter sp.]
MLKRIFDIILSIIVIFLSVPILIIIILLIKFTSKGPVFFIQERIGLNGKYFKMIKFRTMLHNTEKEGTGLYSFEDDPRITKLGHFLRRTSLDEFPQFLNVLVGSMSIVGPRPPVTYELGNWSTFNPTMRKRFKVKPGITGFSQIYGRNSLGWDRKIAYDILYINKYKRFGLLLDIYIIYKTFWIVLTGQGILEKKEEMNLNKKIAKRAQENNKNKID